MKAHRSVRKGGRESLKNRGTVCLNCNHPLDISDVYCPYCSQKNNNEQLNFIHFVAEYASSQIVYDTRLRNTLSELLFFPGRMTRNYIKGQRVRYANPFRFFLSVSIIYFLLQGFIEKFSDNPVEKNDDIVNITSKLGDSNSSSQKIESEDYEYATEAGLDSLPKAEGIFQRFDTYREFYERHKTMDETMALKTMNHPDSKFNKWLYHKNLVVEKIMADPSAFGNYFLSKTPFFIFFFIPFYALFFWLIYSKNKFSYTQHVVFNYHIFSFLFLFMLLSILPGLIFGNVFFQTTLFLFVGPFYFYKALRNFYRQSRLLTIIKFVLLSLVFFISAGIATLLFISLSISIY